MGNRARAPGGRVRLVLTNTHPRKIRTVRAKALLDRVNNQVAIAISVGKWWTCPSTIARYEVNKDDFQQVYVVS